NDHHIRGTAREQAYADNTGNLVDFAFDHERVGDHQAVDVENPVAVVGGDALAPDRLAAGVGEDVAADEAAGHRNDFNREGETAEDLDLLCRVDDTHELFRGLGDDLFPGERRAAALDQALLRIAFIGAIDVKRDRTGEVEVEDLDAVAAEPFSALVGAGD